MEYQEVKSDNQERSWSTGSIRGLNTDKGRYDLIPEYALYRVARHYQNGAKRYGDNNWLKGQNLRTFLDSAIRHIFMFKAGFRDEDHCAAAIFNLLGLIETEKMISDNYLPSELNDLRIQPYKKENSSNTPYVNDVKQKQDKISDVIHKELSEINSLNREAIKKFAGQDDKYLEQVDKILDEAFAGTSTGLEALDTTKNFYRWRLTEQEKPKIDQSIKDYIAVGNVEGVISFNEGILKFNNIYFQEDLKNWKYWKYVK